MLINTSINTNINSNMNNSTGAGYFENRLHKITASSFNQLELLICFLIYLSWSQPVKRRTLPVNRNPALVTISITTISTKLLNNEFKHQNPNLSSDLTSSTKLEAGNRQILKKRAVHTIDGIYGESRTSTKGDHRLSDSRPTQIPVKGG